MLRQVQTMSRLPRMFGAETKFTPSGGIAQLLLNEARADILTSDDRE